MGVLLYTINAGKGKKNHGKLGHFIHDILKMVMLSQTN
jgi:hypothetical protein